MHHYVTPWLEYLGSTHTSTDLFLASGFWCHYFNHPRTNFPYLWTSDKMSTSLIRIQGEKTNKQTNKPTNKQKTKQQQQKNTRPSSLSLDNTRCWLWAFRTLWMSGMRVGKHWQSGLSYLSSELCTGSCHPQPQHSAMECALEAI